MIMKWWSWGAENKQANLVKIPKFLPYVERISRTTILVWLLFKRAHWELN